MTFSPGDPSEDIVEIALGTLDTNLDMSPDAHIFVESKASWSEIHDGMPQYAGDRNSRRLK